MDSKTIYLKRQSSDTMLDLSQKIMDDMRKESPNAEVVVYNIEHVGEAEVLLLDLEQNIKKLVKILKNTIIELRAAPQLLSNVFMLVTSKWLRYLALAAVPEDY